ncbi:patatin-like phospholipase family protein [Bradyrhizobium sp.]|uniref:patatin-like phospholipase family protein n=1 Tax=Bradyrhizobium sp. TaxID=376 RepID=UPI002619AB23|nr:patatin-like phospholipase family protein [Bradyrhizobium sp.]
MQGGGALGSYQAGAYEALADSEYLPDWVAGISIGSINAAIIAGNAPEDRLSRLRAFWEQITSPSAWWPAPQSEVHSHWHRRISASSALAFGQPGFFTPRIAMEWLGRRMPTSFYDTSALRGTLERLVDFDRINHAKETRLSVGAVNLRTGQLVYFDSAEQVVGPEHVMASGALPPGFPPVEIDGEQYWDGGLVSNTPLQYVLDYYPRRSRLTFQIDLFQGYGQIPIDLEGVGEREKEIRYSSRTRISTENFRQKHEVRHAISELGKLLPKELADSEQAKRLYAFGCMTEMDIAQLIYRPMASQGDSKDYQFDRRTMDARWRQGAADAAATLLAAPWLAPKPQEVGVRVFDVMHDILVGKKQHASEPMSDGVQDRPPPRRSGIGSDKTQQSA